MVIIDLSFTNTINNENVKKEVIMNMKTVFTAIALSTLSVGAFAATEIQYPQGQEIGSVSASANTLDSLQAKLAAKADAAGAKTFQITSVQGDDTLHGNAILFK